MAATIQIGTEKLGTRVYVTGNTYPIKAELKSAGCHWDGDRKLWWIGAAKAESIAAIVGGMNGKEAPKEDLDGKRIYAKVSYKGRNYYVIAEGTEKVRLTVLDGSIDFWADRGLCELVKRYEVRTRFGGYGRGQVEVYQTLGSMRRFIAESRQADKQIAAGEIPDGYCVDNEDGMVKRRSECDMPAD